MKDSKVITCVSIMPGNGAKYVATMMAHELVKKYPKKKVALVDFDLTNPYMFASQTANDKVHGIDNLLDKISAEVMNNSLFMANMIEVPGSFSLLKGTRKAGRESMVTRLHISKIVEFLRHNYDYIVMAVPSDSDNAATNYGLFHSDKIVTIVRPNYPNLLNIEDRLKKYRVLRNSENVTLYMMYNMRSEKDDIEPYGKYIEDYDLYPLGYLTYEPATVDNKNIGGNVLQEMSDKFSRSMKRKGNGGNNASRISSALDIMLGVADENKTY